MEEADGSAVAVLTEQGQLQGLMCGLNRRGMRERALLTVLRRRQKLLAESMSGRAPAIVPDVLQQTDRCVPCSSAVCLHQSAPKRQHRHTSSHSLMP